LKEKGCIIDVFQKPYVINPLTVSVNDSGKHILVLDLRHVNKYVQKQKIKFEGILEAKQYAKKDFFMVKWDMRSGYHHLNIYSEHQQFLGFSWNIDGKDRYFFFFVLPFGLCSTGHIFIKVVRVLVNYWRSQCWACDSYERCARMAKIVHQDLLDAGFLPNNEKSIPYLHLHKS
jgi:hypothetical protein